MSNYCIIHEVKTDIPIGEKSDCVIVSCPPPENEPDWELHVMAPSPREIAIMDLEAKYLELSL